MRITYTVFKITTEYYVTHTYTMEENYMVNGIPSGYWHIEGNTLKPTHSTDPYAIFSIGGNVIPAHEPYSTIGMNNTVDLFSPDGGRNLSDRLIAMTVDSMNSRFAAQNSGRSNDYFIYGTGIFSSD